MHDYWLDFDEDEALLAIVSVCAFAIMLVDQMSERLSFDRAVAAVVSTHAPASTRANVDTERPLADRIADAMKSFRPSLASDTPSGSPRHAEVIGALAGYLASTLPQAHVDFEPKLGDSHLHADLAVAREDQRVIIEVKHIRHPNALARRLRESLAQLGEYMRVAGVGESLLYFYSDGVQSPIEKSERTIPGLGRVIVVGPTSVDAQN